MSTMSDVYLWLHDSQRCKNTQMTSEHCVCVCVCGGSVASEASRRCSDRTPSGESVTSRRSLLWLCALSHSVRREEESRGDDGKSTNSNKKEEFEYNLIYIIDWQKERKKTFFLPVKASSLGRIVSYKTRRRANGLTRGCNEADRESAHV